MEIEQLLKNPNEFRSGENFNPASNIVFPVEFEGEKYVVKMPRSTSFFQQTYYWAQDLLLCNRRSFSLSPGRKGLESEFEKLQKLEGLPVPDAVAYNNGVLIRSYEEGTDFRNLDEEGQIDCLENAVDLLAKIHERGVVVGAFHPKNLFLYKSGESGMLDFDGVCKPDSTTSRAADLITAIYLTYTATRDVGMVRTIGSTLGEYPAQEVLVRANNMISSRSALSLKFPTRVTKEVHKEIKDLFYKAA